nr:integrase, catalytic region, zinc finger, CCHC-type, peptidase aspartic, catalytic [Tanacetum cinerariifolium]
MFRINPSKTSREEKHVSNIVNASNRTKPITVSQLPVITKNDVNSDLSGLSSTGVDNTKTRRPQPRSNTKHDRVTSASKSSRSKNKEAEVEEHHRNLLLSKNNKHISSACNDIQLDSQDHMPGNLKLLINFVWKFMGTVRFRNDHVAAILGFGDLQWGNILITKVYFVEGLGHNLFSVGQFCESNLEVTFRRNACFVRNLEGVDLLKGDRSTNLYTINFHDMASASPICLMARASSTKSWLWHQRLSHLNFDTINDLARNDLVSEAARTMLIFSHAPLFLWAEAIATACFTQNRSIIYRRFNKTPYELINGRKSDISFLHVFGALCYPKNDREDIVKLDAKGDIGFFIGSKPRLQSMTSRQISSGLDLTYAPSTITTQQPSKGELDLLFEAMYDDYIGGQPLATARTVSSAQEPQVRDEMIKRLEDQNMETNKRRSWSEPNLPNPHRTYGMAIDYWIMKEGMSILRGRKFVPGMNSNEREMERKGKMMFFLGLQVNQSSCGIFTNQSKYVLEILNKYGMESCDPVGTLMEIKDKLDLDQNGTPVDATKYRSMIGALMYLTSSRPNIDSGFELTGFLDADYAGCKDTFKSTSDGAQFLGEKLCRMEILPESTSNSSAVGTDDGVTTLLQLSRNSRPPMLEHQDKYMMKSQIIMVNVIPPNHVDDVPIVELDQHDDVPVVPEPVLVDEDEGPEEDEFMEEEDPQEEEDDMVVDIEEDENEPELTYPYKEMDPLNTPPPVSESEPKDAIKVEKLIEHEDETVPASVHKVGESATAPFLREETDGLLPGLMRRDINSLFGRMSSLSRRLYGHEMTHALVEKKGKAKDELYGKLILDLGNEVRSSMKKGTTAMEKLVEKLGNAEDKKEASGSRPVRCQDAAPAARECTFAGFMKSNSTSFCGTEGVVELLRWFEKTESVFGISKYAEGKKVRFAAATLQGPALTWWNARIEIRGLETVNQMP